MCFTLCVSTCNLAVSACCQCRRGGSSQKDPLRDAAVCPENRYPEQPTENHHRCFLKRASKMEVRLRLELRDDPQTRSAAPCTCSDATTYAGAVTSTGTRPHSRSTETYSL